MAEVGTVEVRVGTRISEEARRELKEMAELVAKLSATSRPLSAASPLKPLPPARARRVTTTARTKKPDPSIVDYIRKEHPEDQILQSLADILDKNKGVWQAMMQFYKLNVECGDGLRGWDVQRRMDVREPLTTTVSLELIDKEGTIRARS